MRKILNMYILENIKNMVKQIYWKKNIRKMVKKYQEIVKQIY